MECFYHNISKFLLKQAVIKTSVSSCGVANLACKFYDSHGKERSHHTEGTPIIILHTFLASMKHWDSITKHLVEQSGYPVITIDARNHGSSPHISCHDYYYMARDLNAFIKRHVRTSVMLIGHGMGGKTAMYLALHRPKRVVSLVSVDASPVTHPSKELKKFYIRLLDAMNSVQFGAKDVKGGISEAKYWLKKAGVIEDSRAMTFILSNVGMRQDNTIGWLCNVELFFKHLDDIFGFPLDICVGGKTYPGPAFFVAGKDSSAVLEGDLRGIKQFFPKAELRFIEGAGHCVHEDCPETFLDLVCKFYRDHTTLPISFY